MITLTATELKGRLGEVMEKAQREPIAVNKAGRPYAVILSAEDYERLQALEDYYWSERARAARESGYLTHEESMDLIRRKLEEA